MQKNILNKGFMKSVQAVQSSMRNDEASKANAPKVIKTNMASRIFSRFNKASSQSHFRRVFTTSDTMKREFVKFLKTVFFQLDDRKVLAGMEKLLADPTLSDEQIYKALVDNIHTMKRSLYPLWQIWSLFVLKDGMGKQAKELTDKLQKDRFHNYLEVYDKRYFNTLRKEARLPLDGNVAVVCDYPKSPIKISDRIQAGSFFSSYPYTQIIDLNDPDCKDPLLETEKTYKPLGNEIKDDSLDLVACLGGLHHAPSKRVTAFLNSLKQKMRPGGVVLFRDHNVKAKTDVSKQDLESLVSVVHSFVNAADGVSWDVEKNEIRKFKSMEDWTELMKRHGFVRLSSKELVLKDDPTENGMVAFVKVPKSERELRHAVEYRADYKRDKIGTFATWIEWGNVRFSKQYAQFIKNNHSYAFDYLGHLQQHLNHFFNFVKRSYNDEEIGAKGMIFSDGMAMNLFILTSAAVQCSASFLTQLPSRAYAWWCHGDQWRNVIRLTDLEKFEAKKVQEYSQMIDHTPFYQYPYIGKMKEMWKTVWNSQEGLLDKTSSALSAAVSSIGLVASAVISAPIRMFYTSLENQAPEMIQVFIHDPNNELEDVEKKWEKEKDQKLDGQKKIEVIHATPDGYKLVSLPRYRPFTKICGYFFKTKNLKLIEVAGHKKITVDVLAKKGDKPIKSANVEFVYELEQLQDPQAMKYMTYQLDVTALRSLQKSVKPENIDYIHDF